jgi:hypothetical protein
MLFLLCGVPSLCAQNLNYARVETGLQFMQASAAENENIRTEVSTYANPNGVSSYCSFASAAIVFEKFVRENRWSISGGLKYSRMTGGLSSGYNTFDGTDFFFYRYLEEETTTKYVTVESIDQFTDYLGIPLQGSIFPFEPRRFNLYFKAGAEFNFRLKTKTDFVFHDQAMSYLKDQLNEDFNDPGDFNIQVQVSAGIMFGKPGRNRFGLEVPAPSFFTMPSSGGIVKPHLGSGIFVFFMIPLNAASNE